MARNVKQIYDDNPSTSFASTDLLYIGKSPYLGAADSAIKAGDIYNVTNLQLTLGKLNTIQDISTASSPSFAGITLDGKSIILGGNFTTSGAFSSTFTMTGVTSVTFPTSGTLATTAQLPSLPLSGADGGTGTVNSGLTINLASGAVGKVLASDISGNASWADLSTLSVTSISGTSNQISASASTGSVTLSLANGISLGSYQATTPPTGGILAPGRASFGTSTPQPDDYLTVQTTGPTGITVLGAFSSRDGSTNQYGIRFFGAFSPTNGSLNSVMFDTYQAQFTVPFGQIISNAACFRASPYVAFSLGQMTNHYGFWYDGGTGPGSGAIINSYGAYLVKPLNGSITSLALYAENAAIGAAYSGINSPTNGMVIQGNVLIANTANTYNTTLFVNGTVGAATAFRAGDGSASTPSYSFNTSTNTGLWLTAANSIGFSTNGTNKFTLNTSTFDGTLPFRLTSSGTYITINGSSNTYRATNAGSDVSQSIQIFDILGTGAGRLGVDFATGSSDVGLNWNAINTSSNNIRMAAIVGKATSTTAGAEVGSLSFQVKPSGGAVSEIFRIVPSQIQAINGSAGAPVYSFINDTSTGMTRIYTNQIDFVVTGTHRASFLATTFTPAAPNVMDLGTTGLVWQNAYITRILTGTGTASLPAYSFNGDDDNGMFYTGTNSIGMSTAGTQRQNIDSTGNVTFATSSAFMAQLTTTANNVTGDATFYTLTGWTEVIDRNSNFNPTTGVFTSPVTGCYQLNAVVRVNEIINTMTYYVMGISTSNRGYETVLGPATSSYATLTASVLADMDAGDTATVYVIVAGMTKVVDVNGGSYCTFSGFLQC
ncbi:MAG: hypothetical protein EKK56_00905 [Flavobacteriaceae bacterium]|nr:MAG: hypothetical protein EKK56_00905 [Flavobacteriaceae bacterium]